MILSLFDCSGKIGKAFQFYGFKTLTLDIHTGYNGHKTDIVTDILKWDYRAYPCSQFKFIYIALPCQCYSKASGGYHFKNKLPVTSQAYQSINILIRIWQITQYFGCPFVIENPSGGLCNNVFFNAFFKLQITRLSQAYFGFPTQKLTDLFSNFPLLVMSSPVHRVNGRYSKTKLDNLSYRQRVTYTDAFCEAIASSVFYSGYI